MFSRSNSLPISIFRPTTASAADNLKNATRYSRVHLSAKPEAAKEALEKAPHLQDTFVLCHLSEVLIFDNDSEEHAAHVKAVFEMSRVNGMKADPELCSLDEPTWTKVGFHIEQISKDAQPAFLVVLREHLTPETLAADRGSVTNGGGQEETSEP